MLEHYRFRLLSTGESQGVGQGKAKPGDVLGQAQPASGPGQKAPAERSAAAPSSCSSSRWTMSSIGCGRTCSCPICSRGRRSEESEWKREGWDRRGARSRLDRRRSLKESVKRRALEPDRRPSPTRICATDSSPAAASRRCVRPCFSPRRLRQHVRARPTAREDLFLLGGGRTAARIQGARHRVRRTYHRCLGIQ